MLERAAGPPEASAPDPGARLLLVLLLVFLLAPSVLLAYLPMTDLPRHLAVASILLNHDAPRFGFAAFYEPAWGRSLSLLPYLGALALAPLVSLAAGMRAVVVLSLALLPIGVWALLRALRKPDWLALLVLPLVYNRAFFGGCVDFQLALGLSLLALARLVRPPRGVASELALAVLCALIVFTHPYGLLILAGIVCLWLLLGERRALLRHALGLSPLWLGLLAWGLHTVSSAGALTFEFSPLLGRLEDFEASVLGGYRDASEAWLLIGFGVAWALLAARALPVSRERWRSLAPPERVLWAFAASNLLLFAVVPENASSAGEIHMRHALIAMAVLPVLAARDAGRERARFAKLALALLAFVTIANAWAHLIRFDREARGFDEVVERIPWGSRLVALTWDANGAVMRTHPYWHFGAYAQARRGGWLAQSDPRMFGNLPVRVREDARVPASPPLLFAKPDLFDYESFGSFYDSVLVRSGDTQGRDRFPAFRYERSFETGPWQLWRTLPRPVAPPEALESGRLGRLSVFHAVAPAHAFVFLFSDVDGFGPDLVQTAGVLAAQGTTVVGVDLPQYLRGLAASDDGCHYVVAELEALSQDLQRELGYERYRSPLLAGVGAGGTLAYAALAQAPAATLGGALSVDPAPSLGTRVPLCAGAPSTAVAGQGFAYAPRAGLPARLRIATSAPASDALRALAAADPRAALASTQGDTPGARLAAALAPLLTPDGGAPGIAGLAALPLIEIPVQQPGDLFAVIFSGDGGWRDLDKTVAEILARHGVPVVGVDSLRYFWRAKTPERVARDLAAILDTYRRRWGTPHALLVGYSFGAGILPFAFNRLPASERAAVVQLSLLGLEPTAPFEFHVSGWLGGGEDDGPAVLPELLRIDLALVQCFYGEKEERTLCRARELEPAERIRTSGGHHFDGDYEALARKLLEGAKRRMAAARPGAQRAITPATPPEINAAMSVSTKGIARPPGDAR